MLEELKVRTLGSGVVEAGDQVAVSTEDKVRFLYTQHVYLSLSVMKRITDREKRVSEYDENFIRALLAKGLAITMLLEHDNKLREDALVGIWLWVAHKGILVELLQKCESW